MLQFKYKDALERWKRQVSIRRKFSGVESTKTEALDSDTNIGWHNPFSNSHYSLVEKKCFNFAGLFKIKACILYSGKESSISA